MIKVSINIAWLFFDKILKMFVGLGILIWMARYLGPENFGLLNFVVAVSGLFSAFSILGLKDIVVRNIVTNPDQARVTLGTAALLQLIAGIFAYVAMVAAIVFIRPGDDLALSLAVILGATLMLKFSDVVVYWFEAQVLSKYTVWVQNAVFIFFALMKLILVAREATLASFAWVMLIEATLISVFLIILMNSKGMSLCYLRISMRHAGTLLKDSWPLIISAISVTLYMRIDQIMLGQMIGDDAVGIYSAAVRISEAWYFIPLAVCASIFPKLLEVKRRSEEEYYIKLQKLFEVMVMISLVIAVPMTFMSTLIVNFVYGETYAASGPVLALHIWASVFVFIGVASSQWFVAQNRQVLHLKRTLLGAATNILLNLWLVPNYQTIGAAIATIISYLISAFVSDLLDRETHRLFIIKLQSLTFYRQIKSRVTPS